MNARALRLFITIPAAGDICRAVANLVEQLRAAGADYKWVDPGNLHLTVRFFGETPVERLPEIAALMKQAAASPAFELAFSGLGAFGSWQEPRVLWIGVSRGAAELAAVAAALGPAEEGRPFAAHLTVGRMRSGRGRDRLRAVADKVVFPEMRQQADRLVLFESRLTAGGPIYEIRAEQDFSER